MSPELERPRILLVEDEVRVAEFLERGLCSDGLDVTVAQDGDVGAFLAATERFDLVLLDLVCATRLGWYRSSCEPPGRSA